MKKPLILTEEQQRAIEQVGQALAALSAEDVWTEELGEALQHIGLLPEMSVDEAALAALTISDIGHIEF